MALTVTRIGGASTNSNPLGSGTFTAPTTGDLLICIASTGNNDGTQQVSSVTDSAGGTWTEISNGAGSVMDCKWWYKVSDGTETSVTVTYTTASGNDMIVLQASGWTNTPTLEGFDEHEGNLGTADGDGSIPTTAAPIGNTTASALIIAFVASDTFLTLTDSGAMSDGTGYTAGGDQGGQIYTFYREVSSTSTYSPVYTYSDTGDEAYAAAAVFGDAAAGSGFQPAWARGSNVLLKAA